jgi:hypothetical protein
MHASSSQIPRISLRGVLSFTTALVAHFRTAAGELTAFIIENDEKVKAVFLSKVPFEF